ncbi:DNA/RNA non-specific endonuclease [Streptomyces huasconensis]|uniref:DNA/RNA non-specific endonuclease n=1 Tax=Streptomyces huasconensis TaxID=1854574 RepID=UPI0037000B8E
MGRQPPIWQTGRPRAPHRSLGGTPQGQYEGRYRSGALHLAARLARGRSPLQREARGHLLARKLGGPGMVENGYRNLVTLTQNPVNTPIMRGIEKEMHQAVSKVENVQYSVVPVYEGTNPIPTRLNISAHGDRGFSPTAIWRPRASTSNGVAHHKPVSS